MLNIILILKDFPKLMNLIEYDDILIRMMISILY